MVQWLRLCLPVQGVWVWSLVGELKSHMPCGQKNQNIKQKQYCNKFSKDFKNGPHQKKKSKKSHKCIILHFWKWDVHVGLTILKSRCQQSCVPSREFISLSFPASKSCPPSLTCSPFHLQSHWSLLSNYWVCHHVFLSFSCLPLSLIKIPVITLGYHLNNPG